VYLPPRPDTLSGAPQALHLWVMTFAIFLHLNK